MKKAIITGITGQDGAYLAELLLRKGYAVYGTFRRTSSVNFWRLEELGVHGDPNMHLVEYDVTDGSNSVRLVSDIKPDEIYNLAAQSYVAVSFEQPVTTAQITGLGALNLLEAVRIVNPKIKFYQASTSELFGKVQETPQNERTPFYPRSPYAVSKLFAHWSTVNYRESYDIFACSGILFNHESPLRGKEFVTRKITDAVARIHLGKLDALELGNLDARRDWGFAKEYVEGMYLMMQHREPGTYILATGKNHSVRQFAELAFRATGVELEWKGSQAKETGIDRNTGRTVVRINPRFYRPCEVDHLVGDSQKAEKDLGWKPVLSLEDLCRMMVEADIRRNTVGISF